MPGISGPEVVPLRDLLPLAFEFPDADPPRLLRFDASYWDVVIAGRKTATTRFRERVDVGAVHMLFEFDDQYRTMPGLVEAVDSVRVADITEEMAALEGCTAEELRAGLQAGHYADLGDEDIVDFVRFRVIEPAE